MGQQIEVARAQSAIQIKEGNFPPEPTWFASISPTATTLSICSHRSTTRKMEKRLMMMSPGNSPLIYHLQAIPTADASIRDVALTAADRCRRIPRDASSAQVPFIC